MTDKIRLGVIGLGAQGGMYAQMIAAGRVPNMELGAICDNDPEKAAVAASGYPSVPFFADYRALLDSGTIDAVVTTVPHYMHPEIGIAALGHGIHALVEKPAGVYSKQVAELNEVAASLPDVTFALMFNQRANPLYVRLKEIIDAGEIGDILRSNWIITTWWRPQGYYDQSEWRATWGGEGGGVLVNQAPHQLDLWQWLCGVPQSVYAKVAYGFRRDIVVEDEVTAVVDYGNGATGVFITATHDLVGTDRLEILGTAGKIVVEGSATATVTRLTRPERELSASMDMSDVMKLFMGGGNTDDLYSQETIAFPSAWGAQHADVLQNFAAAILDGTPLLASGSEGIRGVRLANAIHLSSWTGREIPLDFDEDEFLTELNTRIRAEGRFEERVMVENAMEREPGIPQIGVQAMMLKDSFAQAGVFETLRQVSEIGYSAVEISQIPMTEHNVAELARARAEFGMQIAALSAALTAPPGMPAESLTTGFDKIVADAGTLGATMVRMGMLPFDAMASLDAVLEFCDRSEEMAGRLAEHGIGLYYHNHHIEFAKYGGRYLLDVIADRAPSMGLEIDVHWVQRGGLDPVRTLEKYGDRVAMVHLKDYRIGQLPPEAFEALATGNIAAFMAAFTGVVQFAEVGEGNLDFPAIIEASTRIGAKYLLVEQDDLYGRTPLECLQTSYDNLVQLGFRELF